MTDIHEKHFILVYDTFDHGLYYELIGDRLENCCAKLLKQGKHQRLMFLTKTVKWKRTFHVVQLMASDWWDASSIANIQVYTRCRKWVFAFSFACIYLLAFTCTNSWTEIYKFGKYDVVQMLILFHHKNLVLVQHTESTLSIVYLLLQQLISLRSKHLCKKICLCFWTNNRSEMKIKDI